MTERTTFETSIFFNFIKSPFTLSLDISKIRHHGRLLLRMMGLIYAIFPWHSNIGSGGIYSTAHSRKAFARFYPLFRHHRRQRFSISWILISLVDRYAKNASKSQDKIYAERKPPKKEEQTESNEN